MDPRDAPDIRELRVAHRVARKRHECAVCGQAIEPGQKYTLYVTTIDGKFSVDKFHPSALCVLDAGETE